MKTYQYSCHIGFACPLIVPRGNLNKLKTALREVLSEFGIEDESAKLSHLAYKGERGDPVWNFEGFCNADLLHYKRHQQYMGAQTLRIAPGWWEVEDYFGGRVILQAHNELDALINVCDSEPGIVFSTSKYLGRATMLPKLTPPPEPSQKMAKCFKALQNAPEKTWLVEIIWPEMEHYRLDQLLDGNEAEQVIKGKIVNKIMTLCKATEKDHVRIEVKGRWDGKRWETYIHYDTFGMEFLNTKWRERFVDCTPQQGWHYFGNMSHRMVWGTCTADASRTLFQHRFQLWSVKPLEAGTVIGLEDEKNRHDHPSADSDSADTGRE